MAEEFLRLARLPERTAGARPWRRWGGCEGGVKLGVVKTWVENPKKRDLEFSSDRRRKLDGESRK